MMTRRARRMSAMLSGVLLTTAACGGASDQVTTPAIADAPAATVADGGSVSLPENLWTEPESDGATSDEPDDTSSATTPAVDQPAATEAELPATETPAATEAPASGVVGGRQFAETIDAAANFGDNPFPDLVVDDVGRGTKANIINVLPSDRPVLLWTWAPH